MIDIAKIEVGDWVEYDDGNRPPERGRVKSVSHENYRVFVVFKCGGAWDDYQNYTAAGCKPKNLRAL